jgi:RimJ/RimL family protein N-acetyltransferase
MNAPAVLRTPLLTLAPFGAEHLSQRYVSWLNDPEVVRHSEQRHRAHSLESCRAYVESFADSPSGLWAMLTRQGGHVGNVTATVDAPNAVAELGILIGERSHWGRGLATQAWTALADHIFRARGLRKLVAGAMAENAAMLRVAEKLGMRQDGRRARHFLLDGREVDAVLFALFREDWLARHPLPPYGPNGEGPEA